MSWFSKLLGFSDQSTNGRTTSDLSDSSSVNAQLASQTPSRVKASERWNTILPPLPAPEVSANPMVWYVDDEDVNLVVFETVMQPTGYRIRMFNSAESLLKAIIMERQIPHLILSDIMMPQMSGYDLVEIVRETFDWDTLPVIMFSAKNREEDVCKALDLGANDFLFKPLNRSDFLNRIRMCIRIADAT